MKKKVKADITEKAPRLPFTSKRAPCGQDVTVCEVWPNGRRNLIVKRIGDDITLAVKRPPKIGIPNHGS
jgi:hypothetical protein